MIEQSFLPIVLYVIVKNIFFKEQEGESPEF